MAILTVLSIVVSVIFIATLANVRQDKDNRGYIDYAIDLISVNPEAGTFEVFTLPDGNKEVSTHL